VIKLENIHVVNDAETTVEWEQWAGGLFPTDAAYCYRQLKWRGLQV